MSHILEIRGGEPNIRRIASVTTTGRLYEPDYKDAANGRYKFYTKHIQIYNTGANALRLFFNQADFDADANYHEIAATSGTWEGPAEAKGVWLKSAAATTAVTVIYYQRRG